MAIMLRRALLRLRRPQFGLRGLFVVITAVGLWLGVYVERARERQSAVRAIKAVGGSIEYDFQETQPNSGQYDDRISSPLPNWLRASLGDDFFYDVQGVDFFVQHWSSDADAEVSQAAWAAIMPRLPALSRLKRLSLKAPHLTDKLACYIGELKRLETLYIEDAYQLTMNAPCVSRSSKDSRHWFSWILTSPMNLCARLASSG